MPYISKIYLLEESNKRLKGDIDKCEQLLNTKNDMIELMQNRILSDNTFINEFNKFYLSEYKKLNKRQRQKLKELKCLTV